MKKIKLIVHVGLGKTGTTSIQQTLKLSKHRLLKNNVGYLGIMLENAPIKFYDWQTPYSIGKLLGLKKGKAQAQLKEVLLKSVKWAEKEGLETLIWSNESLIGLHELLIPVFRGLKKQNVDVMVVIYVRRYDAWAKSAYIQWGIKHKRNKGKLLSFQDFMTEFPIRTNAVVSAWYKEKTIQVMLRNYDVIDDVVEDFFDAVGILMSVASTRTNTALLSEELLLRALFNNVQDEFVLPRDFNRVFMLDKINIQLEPEHWLSEMLPDGDALRQVMVENKEAIKKLNSMLAGTGQPEILADQLDVKSLHIDRDKLLNILIQIIILQAVKLERLSTQIEGLLEDR